MSHYLGEPLGVPQLPNVHCTGKRSELRQSLVGSVRVGPVEAGLSYGFIGNRVGMVVLNPVALRSAALPDIRFRGVTLNLGEESRERGPCTQAALKMFPVIAIRHEEPRAWGRPAMEEPLTNGECPHKEGLAVRAHVHGHGRSKCEYGSA